MKNLPVAFALFMTYITLWIFYIAIYMLSVGITYVLNIIFHVDINIWIVGLIIFNIYIVHRFAKNAIINAINTINKDNEH